MTNIPAASPPTMDPKEGWTTATYAAHNEALRQAEWRLAEERDRRYAEVALEREKALRIKEEADKAALLLAREIQTYKDEKANELREQINSERGLYATKGDLDAVSREMEAIIKPLADFVTQQQGRTQGMGIVIGGLAFLATTLIALAGIALVVLAR